MRRNWFGGLLFALALAIQALAPVASSAARAHAFTARNASVTGVVCLAAGGYQTPDRQPSSPGRSNHNRDCCPLCGVCFDGASPLVSRSVQIAGAPVEGRTIALTAADLALPASRRDHARQARAPPVFS